MATSSVSTIRSAAASAHAAGSASVTIVGSVIGSVLRSRQRSPGELGGQGQRLDGNPIAAAGLDRLRQEVHVGLARCGEPALERVAPVLPDPNVNGLLLSGDVGPQLRPAPVGK